MEIVTKKDFTKIIKVLRKGGVIAYPTETAYGLGVDAENKKAIEKIYKIKKREKKKPVIIIVSSVKMSKKYAHLNKIALKLVDKFMPGPLTIVCNKTKKVPAILSRKDIAFRISSDKFVQKLVKKYGKAIVSTSANISGKSALYRAIDVKKQFYGNIDLLVDGGNIKKKKLSTVFDTINLKLLREGAVSKKKIIKSL